MPWSAWNGSPPRLWLKAEAGPKMPRPPTRDILRNLVLQDGSVSPAKAGVQADYLDSGFRQQDDLAPGFSKGMCPIK